MRRDLNSGLDGGLLVMGMLLGMVTGALVALFAAPKSGREFRDQVSETVTETSQQIKATVTPPDPVAESLAEGKAAARRRRAELGLE